jgi:uncharacterized protein
LIIEVLILLLGDCNSSFSSSPGRKVVVFMQEKGEAPVSKNTVSWVYREEAENEPAPWGPHRVPAILSIDGVDIAIDKGASGYYYHREGAGEIVDKIILSGEGSLFLIPVEPMQKPVTVASHLLIEFKQPLVLEPRTARKVFVTFPLEIAVSFGYQKSVEGHLDLFTLSRVKYTLYGLIKDGMICRFWQSDIYGAMPKVNPLCQGIMEIAIENNTAGWVEVGKTVLSAHGMKIFYGQNYAAAKATMKIVSDKIAETGFNNTPLENGLEASSELFTSKLLNQQGKTVMEEGY